VSAPARVPLFVNARAGMSGDATDEIAQLDPGLFDVRPTEPARLTGEVGRAAAAGAAIIAIAGGDGSMRSAAAALIGTGSALLAVPTGTLNHFAQRCGIDDVAAAVAALRALDIRTQAVGFAGEHVFLNTLTIGEYARTVRLRDRWRPYMGKWPAALLAFIITVLSMRRIDVTMQTDEQKLTRSTPFVWIGMGWGSFPLVHEALERRSSPDLEVAVFRETSRLGNFALAFRLGWRMLLGEQPVRDDALEMLHTRTLTLAARHTIDATADGEVLKLPARVVVTVRDDALRIVVGPSFQEATA
jgi:diacylglycerol kinase family enzyme